MRHYDSTILSTDQIVTHRHTVSGEIWVSQYVGNKTKIDLLKEAVKLQLKYYLDTHELTAIEPPATTIEYDEQCGLVTVQVECVAR